MNRLFRENERYNLQGDHLSNQATQALQELAKPYIEAGYSLRDIGNVLTMAAFDASVSIALEGIETRRTTEEKARLAKMLNPRQLRRAVRELMAEEKKIDAIVLVRRNTEPMMGLLEAKKWVEKIGEKK